MERYKIGHVMPLRVEGKHVANARIFRQFVSEDGEMMIEAEIMELSPRYDGPLKVGTRVTFPLADLAQ